MRGEKRPEAWRQPQKIQRFRVRHRPRGWSSEPHASVYTQIRNMCGEPRDLHGAGAATARCGPAITASAIARRRRQSAFAGGAETVAVGLPFTVAPFSVYVISVVSQSRSPIARAVYAVVVPVYE